MDATRFAAPPAQDAPAIDDEEAPLSTAPQHSLTERVRDEIERRIAAGQLAPGDKLVEADWATRLAVSRGPVREAFRALEQAGLVRNEKHRGVFVRRVGVAEARELGEVCAALREAACRMLAARIDSAMVAQLRERLDAMRAALVNADGEAFLLARDAFRAALVASAGNERLRETHARAVSELRLAARRVAPASGAMEIAYAGHRALLSALASRDADESSLRMRASCADEAA
ncbi:GntR family transcriptional regulator [Paraburkholderia acidisoli]|uniref:GntR family transcriptional regulator n=1 Tax=Paraburkholderia acidisoli TaxID=2571748 RepID=A0A7Z2GLP4_9BURK|nr:GntR family transcriptional regulator [Paraburkholderia acidisoli]QGZ64111.1 GntR family transcriptional regulator [Paraburkholderia acidisoli]